MADERPGWTDEATPPPRIAVVVSKFPHLTETFIVRELVQLQRLGLDLSVYSLKTPSKEAIVQPEAEPLFSVTHYAPFLCSLRLWRSNLRWMLNRPGAYIGNVLTAVRYLWRFPGELGKTLLTYPKIAHFADQMERERVAHCHAHWATVPTAAALFIQRLTGIPYSFTAHAWDVHHASNRPFLPLKVRRAEFVVTCTEFSRAFLRPLASGTAEKIRCSYHGLDLGQYPSTVPEPETPTITAGGSLTAQKGLHVLVRAVAILGRDGLRPIVYLLGEGPERSRLERLVSELDVEDQIIFTGALPHHRVMELMLGSQLVVLPSVVAPNGFMDGLPNILAEAMALGRPVVSTRLAGIPELVTAECGMLVSPGDPEALASGLADLLQDADRRHRMGKAGRKRVEQMFDLGDNVQTLYELFQRTGPGAR